MPSGRLLTPFRRDLLLTLVALGLLTAPLIGSVLHVGDPTYEYERIEVTANETSIEYAGDDVPIRTPISDRIACAYSWETRSCAFERLLLDNRTVPMQLYSSSTGTVSFPLEERYRYVLLEEGVYETTYVANGSTEREDGMHRVELDLERTSGERALQRVSADVTADYLSSTAAEAARTGRAQSAREIDVPRTPIRLEDETYYRVYLAERNQPSPMAETLDFLLTYPLPVAGIALIVRLSRRIEVGYVGDDDRR